MVVVCVEWWCVLGGAVLGVVLCFGFWYCVVLRCLLSGDVC